MAAQEKEPGGKRQLKERAIFWCPGHAQRENSFPTRGAGRPGRQKLRLPDAWAACSRNHLPTELLVGQAAPAAFPRAEPEASSPGAAFLVMQANPRAETW